ncbi:hypothetical protein HAX54_039366 [Datura stramonium]|uniref:Uncharacterized protein n=1 Tax=Datura stramonium TaxID=4076 RepID=A0ABS8VQD5_DATST|nr:hypothetical protein [Datura stramonium]
MADASAPKLKVWAGRLSVKMKRWLFFLGLSNQRMPIPPLMTPKPKFFDVADTPPSLSDSKRGSISASQLNTVIDAVHDTMEYLRQDEIEAVGTCFLALRGKRISLFSPPDFNYKLLLLGLTWANPLAGKKFLLTRQKVIHSIPSVALLPMDQDMLPAYHAKGAAGGYAKDVLALNRVLEMLKQLLLFLLTGQGHSIHSIQFLVRPLFHSLGVHIDELRRGSLLCLHTRLPFFESSAGPPTTSLRPDFLDFPEIRPPTLCYSLHALDPTVLILPLGIIY